MSERNERKTLYAHVVELGATLRKSRDGHILIEHELMPDDILKIRNKNGNESPGFSGAIRSWVRRLERLQEDRPLPWASVVWS